MSVRVTVVAASEELDQVADVVEEPSLAVESQDGDVRLVASGLGIAARGRVVEADEPQVSLGCPAKPTVSQSTKPRCAPSRSRLAVSSTAFSPSAMALRSSPNQSLVSRSSAVTNSEQPVESVTFQW